MNTFTDYLYYKQYAKSTIRETKRAVIQFLNWLHKENIKDIHCHYNDIMAYVQDLQTKQVKPSYINTCLSSLKKYFMYLIQIKKVKHNPVIGIRIRGTPRNKIMQHLTEDELELLFLQFHNHAVYTTPEVKDRDIVLLGLVVFQALSIHELNKLLITDVNLEAGTITIPLTTKSNERVLNLNAKQMLHLMHYTYSKQGGKLFDVRVVDCIPRLFNKLKAYDNKLVSYKELRTGRIISWLKHHHIRQVQYYTGMKYISSLRVYQNQLTDGLAEKINQFHPLNY